MAARRASVAKRPPAVEDAERARRGGQRGGGNQHRQQGKGAPHRPFVRANGDALQAWLARSRAFVKEGWHFQGQGIGASNRPRRAALQGLLPIRPGYLFGMKATIKRQMLSTILGHIPPEVARRTTIPIPSKKQ